MRGEGGSMREETHAREGREEAMGDSVEDVNSYNLAGCDLHLPALSSLSSSMVPRL